MNKIQWADYQIVYVSKRVNKYQENKTKNEGNSLPLFMYFEIYHLALLIYNYSLHTILSKYYFKKYWHFCSMKTQHNMHKKLLTGSWLDQLREKPSFYCTLQKITTPNSIAEECTWSIYMPFVNRLTIKMKKKDNVKRRKS